MLLTSTSACAAALTPASPRVMPLATSQAAATRAPAPRARGRPDRRKGGWTAPRRARRGGSQAARAVGLRSAEASSAPATGTLPAPSTYGKTRVLPPRPAHPERTRTSAPIQRRVERARNRLLTVSEGHLFTPASRAGVPRDNLPDALALLFLVARIIPDGWFFDPRPNYFGRIAPPLARPRRPISRSAPYPHRAAVPIAQGCTGASLERVSRGRRRVKPLRGSCASLRPFG